MEVITGFMIIYVLEVMITAHSHMDLSGFERVRGGGQTQSGILRTKPQKRVLIIKIYLIKSQKFQCYRIMSLSFYLLVLVV